MKSDKSVNGGGLLTRREFGILAAAGLTLAGLPLGGLRARGSYDAGPEEMVFLEGVARGSGDAAISEAVKSAACACTDFSWLKKGDTVFVKPVVNSGNDYPATTSPIGMRAVVELLKEKGAGRVLVGDMSGIEHVKLTEQGLKKGSTRELMTCNGLIHDAQESGAEICLFEEAGWEAFYSERPAPGSHWKDGIMIPSVLKDADHIVLLPRAGRHLIAGVSLGMKAAVGYLRTDSRLEYHRDAASFYEKTAEMNTVPTLRKKLRLVLTTADKVMTTFGPDTGYVAEPETGLVIASRSIVAHDMASLAWLCINRAATPEAQKKGIKDPYPGNTTTMSRFVVTALGGIKEAAKTQKISSPAIESVWDDPTLKRAFELWGGVPRVRIINNSGTVPASLKKDIENMTAIPA